MTKDAHPEVQDNARLRARAIIAGALGYARVSTVDQTPDLQVDELTAAGCHRIFVERAGGAETHRPQLAEALDRLRPGDTLVVWRLDRLARSLRDLIEIVTTLEEHGVGLRSSLHEQLDTTSPGGKLVFHLFGALAQFERDLIRERTHAGLVAARARGRNGGRPTVMTPRKIARARELYGQGDLTVAEIAKTLRVSRASIYRHLVPSSTPASPRDRRTSRP